MDSKNKQPFLSISRLSHSFKFAVNGIIFTWKNEQNFRIQSLAAAIVILLAQLFRLPVYEQAILFIVIGLVLTFELLNTAIEHTVDLIVQTYDDRAKIIKDTAAGAVSVFSLTAFIIGCIIFIPHIVAFAKSLF